MSKSNKDFTIATSSSSSSTAVPLRNYCLAPLHSHSHLPLNTTYSHNNLQHNIHIHIKCDRCGEVNTMKCEKAIKMWENCSFRNCKKCKIPLIIARTIKKNKKKDKGKTRTRRRGIKQSNNTKMVLYAEQCKEELKSLKEEVKKLGQSILLLHLKLNQIVSHSEEEYKEDFHEEDDEENEEEREKKEVEKDKEAVLSLSSSPDPSSTSSSTVTSSSQDPVETPILYLENIYENCQNLEIEMSELRPGDDEWSML